jgi:hypothetical protein
MSLIFTLVVTKSFKSTILFMTKTQIATLVLLATYLIWEIVVQLWSRTEEGPIIRADLLIIYPILVILIIISLYQRIRNKL